MRSSDFTLGIDLDLVIEGQDFVVGNSDIQNMSLLFNYAPGQLKESPFTGIDIQQSILDDDNPVVTESLIRAQLKEDGGIVNSLLITIDKIECDATY